MKHLYDNEIAPTQSRVAALESASAATQRDIAELKKELDDLRAEINAAQDTTAATLAPAAAKGGYMTRDEMLERDRSLNRDYGLEHPAKTATPAPAELATDDYATGDTHNYDAYNYTGMDMDRDATSELFAIHLASYASTETAAHGWKTLHDEYGDILASLTPWTKTITKADTGETFYRLLAGPLTNRDEADRMCGNLAAGGAYCKVMPFEGDPLIVE